MPFRNIFLIFYLLINPCIIIFGNNQQDTLPANNLKFEENKNQWDTKVLYKVDINGGNVFLEKNTLTYVLYDLSEVEEMHHKMIENPSDELYDKENSLMIKCHAYKMNFIGANQSTVVIPKEKLSTYYNYFKGNDASKWASFVSLYKTITYSNIYNGIDLNVYGTGNNLKYEFIVSPNVEPQNIQMSYEGVDGVKLSKNRLVIKTSVSDVIEVQPYVTQFINGITKRVKCRYKINDNVVGFDFPDGYDNRYPLIIDPVVVASTYSGSTATTYGHCATYDDQGCIYTGGRCFNQGYPVTVGAFQTLYAGMVDIAIAKLNPVGSNMLYATYIGGYSSEYAQSMITNSNGELYIYGSSNSANYPVTAGCFDNSNSGGYDIILSKLDYTGGALLGSTYIGGQANDGYNSMYYNYGDPYRGEIILDISGNPSVASFSSSSNFPTTAGAYDETYNGLQDGVIFKMNTNLTSMIWSTFLGGSNDDAAYGIRTNSVGMVFVVGGTKGNFPTTPVVLHPTYQGGSYDGFISILSNNGSLLMASTYFGTSSFDELFFIDLDANDNVYVYGLSEGIIPPTPGVYFSPGSSGRIITKLDPTLNTIIFSTTFGAGALNSSSNRFAPTAFLVDVCENIYAAGWGTTTSFPVSANAVQPTTDGQDFYLIVLDKDALSLLYATYYGSQVWEHVDGGTSRFDKQGIVYEAVCETGSNFPTNSGSVSNVNNTSWDIAVFKIDFQLGQVLANAIAAPSDTGCAPFTVNFTNSSNGISYTWDFGDGSPATNLFNPSHTFSNPGIYNVQLIATDSMKCNLSDTTYLTINVSPGIIVDIGNDTTICQGNSIILDAGNNGSSYLWSTGATTQTITVNTSGTYWVSVHNAACFSSDTIQINVAIPVSHYYDTTVCSYSPFTLDAGYPGSSYTWSTGANTQNIIVNNSGIYWVDILLGNCPFRDTFDVVIYQPPLVNLGNDTVLCQVANLTLNAENNGFQYLWSTNDTTQSINVTTAGTYTVTVYNSLCNDIDSINVSIVYPPELGLNATLCEQDKFVLNAGSSTGNFYWSTGATSQSIVVSQPGTYWVMVSNSYCAVSDTIIISKGGSVTVYFPNTFTPDEDGLNDIFTGYGTGIEYFEMRIYTRWGQEIFKTDDIKKGWDGTFEGNPVQSDVYVWLADYRTTCTGEKTQRKEGRVFVYR